MFKEKAIKNKEVIQLAENLTKSLPFLVVEYQTGKGYLIAFDFDKHQNLIFPIGEKPVAPRVALAFLIGMRETLRFSIAGEAAFSPKDYEECL